MSRLLLATNNQGKLQELLPILGELPLQLVTPADIGLSLEVDETGTTYAENARLKATAFARASGLATLADDSGLEVDALGSVPGVHSARYAGPPARGQEREGSTDADRRAKLMHALRDVPPPRLARFRCVVAIVAPASGRAETVDLFQGTCEGEIILEERGANGFGYDPIFFIPEYGLTMAELPPETKNRISHRARAAQAAYSFLAQLTSRL